ncbi:molybdopterin-dependent oxidoreductase [Campylobacter sp. JMF_01 NE2]|uniref:molybdopterin-containing oxidoreductase family protein n=1 Tax=unclassified Campylobacter TaxID=2593542 RepID=UPI0022EA0953|nr:MULTISPECIES: molybdopterin-dependent oxidoreductase [unclassified Campylobacter]MDA3052341.1 molybdopterin-dependent oxidoreductase [Campylobacter sp. JMF_03 NE3]MDA3066675.1 molybdopterin-dependent oxidoreductase [Campylobacter sp. JMF_01 NE2]
MRELKITRRNFLKMASSVAVASTAGITGLPNPLMAKTHKNSPELSNLLEYDEGVKTPNYCEMCFWNCGVNVFTRDGKIHKIEGNKLNPYNYGTICAKGNAGVYSTYDPDRLKYPMIRVGKRGEGKWKKVSWDEAFDFVHENLEKIIDKYGAKSIAAFAHGSCSSYFHKFASLLGTPNVSYASFSECRGSRAIGWSLTFGGGGIGGHENYDMANTKYMILFGRNMAGAIQVREARDFMEGLANGAKLVYVDPRQSESAIRAHKWLRIKPGCDMALALALIHVIIRDNLANMEFINKYCYGFDKLARHVKQYTPKWAEEICGIKAETIEEVAWEFAKFAPHVLAIAPRRFSRYANDTQTARAIAILNAIMGNYGVKGGTWVNQSINLAKLPKDDEAPAVREPRADGVGTRWPFNPPNLGLSGEIYRATLSEQPYPIKAWLTYDTNPLGHTAVEANGVMKSIEKLDFLMAIDTQMNDFCQYCDIVLPESTYLEKDDGPYIQKYDVPFVAVRKAAIKPLHDTKHVFDIVRGICKRFDMDEYFTISPSDAINNFVNSLSPDEKAKFEKDGILCDYLADAYPQSSGKPLSFPTSTGKIHLYNPDMEKMYEEYGDVCAPLPTWVAPPMPKEGEFRLLFGRGPAHSHARSQNNKLLLELEDDSPIWINPDDAANLGLKTGDKVIMINAKTGLKSKPQNIKITKRITKGNVFIHHGFGHVSKEWKSGFDKGISDVYFCSNDIDPVSGCSGLNNGFVRLERA